MRRLRVATVITRMNAGAGGVALRGALALDPDDFEVAFFAGGAVAAAGDDPKDEVRYGAHAVTGAPPDDLLAAAYAAFPSMSSSLGGGAPATCWRSAGSAAAPTCSSPWEARWRPRRCAEGWLPAFDVFALASRYEGVPCALVEAVAAGVPVVATAVNAVTDVVVPGETGTGSANGSARGRSAPSSRASTAARTSQKGRAPIPGMRRSGVLKIDSRGRP